MKTLAIVLLSVFTLVACEQQPKVDPNAPKSPEWEDCIAKVEKYADCTAKEAGQLPGGAGNRVAKQMEGKKNKANNSEKMCSAILAKIPADDSCAP